jgi:cell fate regulator YaaT (PSP1 superfamily)
MGCTSCSTGQPGGCKNNGTCGTGGCNKMNVYNWLSNMSLPNGKEPYNIVEVRFKGSRKEYFKNIENLQLQAGEVIAVEGSPGHDIGVVSMAGELVQFQLKKKGIKETSDETKTIYRKAKQVDVEKWMQARDMEGPTMHRARSIALQLKLSMKISDVEYQGDMKKVTFYYTADERVDFRELIKRLAEEFKVRIEMKQIGMRQEASRLGGIGSCGRELCCSTWLSDFRSVSTSAARYQNLSLNPLKLAGQCGKLKCCLNYELDSYIDAIKDFPDTNIPLYTQKGKAFHRKTDIFKRLMWYVYASAPRDNQEGNDSADGASGGTWFAIPVNRVKEIIDLNKRKINPPDLSVAELEAPKRTLDFEDVVGQDSLTRMDKPKSNNKNKHKKRKRPVGDNPNGSTPQQPSNQ